MKVGLETGNRFNILIPGEEYTVIGYAYSDSRETAEFGMSVSINAVPEPGFSLAFALGLVGSIVRRRRRCKH